MRRSRGLKVLSALGASLAALAFTGCTTTSTTSTPIAAELRPLQGLWEGDGAGGKCSIHIRGDTLLYTNSAGWYRTSITLPGDSEPKQLHATVRDTRPYTNGIGHVIFAIYKIEEGVLTLAEDDMSDKPPKSFAEATSRYTVKKVQGWTAPPSD